jgi:hypothetical protein
MGWRYWWCRVRGHRMYKNRTLPTVTVACHDCRWQQVHPNPPTWGAGLH